MQEDLRLARKNKKVNFHFISFHLEIVVSSARTDVGLLLLTAGLMTFRRRLSGGM